jgi:PEP-CTERM motif-containing protein
MNKRLVIGCIATMSVAILIAMPAAANSFTFSTGNPDGKIATLSRVATAGKLETETADDFVTTQATVINSATFTGLLPSGTPLSAVSQVEVELYHVFPIDSTNPPDGRVITRVNSPSDKNFDARDSNLGQLSFTTTLLNPSFPASNSVVNGIHPIPNQFTGGEGAVTGEEVQFNLTFTIPFTVGADHIFFRPEVGLTSGTSGDFLWLSAPKPIVSPGTPFAADLESWIRNDGTGALAPDWERIGTDVTRQGPFNAAFSISGETVPQPAPEPSTLLLLGTGLSMLAGWRPKQWIARETGTRKN